MADGSPMRLVAPVPDDADDAEHAATMGPSRSRPAWAEVDLGAVAHNAGLLARLAAPAELCAVVKAHGYGHGGPPVARAALAGGARRLAVALVDEGVELREHGISAPVLLLSECGAEAAPSALEHGLTPTLYSAEGIATFAAAARSAGRRVAVHVKVDTGMHRVGAAPDDLVAVASAVVNEPMLELEGVWTHLPVADGEASEDRVFTEGQLALFDRLVGDLAAAGIRVPVLHAANTAGSVAFSASRYGMVRCGLGLYGYLPGSPGGAVAAAFGAQAGGEVLRPAMALKARVVAVRTLDAGERPSYGRLRPLPARAVVATVPIGYADGVPRALFGGGYEVLIGGVRRPLAGMVTMDQIVVDCGDDPVQPGDEVVLLGSQGSETITADDWAAMLGTISYEVVCGVGPRMPRIVVNRPDRPGG